MDQSNVDVTTKERRKCTWRFCSDIRVFLVCFSIASMISQALGFYMISQLTTIEKQFGLTSSQSGFLLSANDIGYMIVVLAASHFGRNSNKPLVLGLLSICFGLCAGISSSPHFIMQRYGQDAFFVLAESDESRDSPELRLCHPNVANATSSTDVERSDDNLALSLHIRTISFAVITVALMFQGAIKAPRNPLVTTYIDDHVQPGRAGIYFGVFSSVMIIGVALAFGAGSIFSDIYVSLEDVDITRNDPRWVGAWWLGLVVIGLAAILAGIPLTCFPRRLKTYRGTSHKNKETLNFDSSTRSVKSDATTDGVPTIQKNCSTICDISNVTDGIDAGTVEVTLQEGSDAGPKQTPNSFIIDGRNNADDRQNEKMESFKRHNSVPVIDNGLTKCVDNRKQSITSTLSKTMVRKTDRERVKDSIKDFPKAMLRLARNPIYMLMLFADGIHALVFQGRISYLPKYLENQFLLHPSKANLYFGSVMVVGAALGSISSGLIVSCCNMSPKTCLKFLMISGLLAHLLSMTSAVFTCPKTKFESFDLSHLTLKTRPLSERYDTGCPNKTCWCSDNDFFPICGAYGLNYFSPCHAGCSNGKQSEFFNCSCLSNNQIGTTSETMTTAHAGYCPSKCSLLIAYLIFGFFNAYISVLVIVPKWLLNLRVVKDCDRSLAIGLDAFMITLLGTFLAPIVYGAIIDTSCILWKDSCRLYDVDGFRLKYHLYLGWLGIFAQFFNMAAIALVSYHKKYINIFDSPDGGSTVPVIVADEKVKEDCGLNVCSRSRSTDDVHNDSVMVGSTNRAFEKDSHVNKLETNV